ncbi:MAG: winged helix-turn-helix domain-containing protein [Anaerolineae bacterium]|jgi:DNA-binding transcriptional ArsR family regulator|nr:MAG: winged helix-turn-helix transcriptional regulator [Anaerolineae bacterium]MCL4880185.1 winged helix-turn-helix domain-containing protein [Anaerolineae bacterium]
MVAKIQKMQEVDAETAAVVAETFKILADPTRVRLLAVLATREVCVSELTQLLEMEQSAISHQLRTLRALRLVRNRKVGRQVYYSLEDHPIRDLLTQGVAYAHLD